MRGRGQKVGVQGQGADPVMERFHAFKTPRIYRCRSRRCNRMRLGVREVAGRPRRDVIVDRGPEGRRALASEKAITGPERARCPC